MSRWSASVTQLLSNTASEPEPMGQRSALVFSSTTWPYRTEPGWVWAPWWAEAVSPVCPAGCWASRSCHRSTVFLYHRRTRRRPELNTRTRADGTRLRSGITNSKTQTRKWFNAAGSGNTGQFVVSSGDRPAGSIPTTCAWSKQTHLDRC